MRLKDIKKLKHEWKILLITFFLSASALFLYSIILVSRAASCGSADCMISGLSFFTLTAFILLILNVCAVIYFLIAFFYRESQK